MASKNPNTGICIVHIGNCQIEEKCKRRRFGGQLVSYAVVSQPFAKCNQQSASL